ncbi:MAG TPA: MarR family transcriptional regulator [Gaiellaceae bacterium]|jgi:DNA-binding MarR family transcriptional regulator|nr:MarR family transcriptional regulator [Gaiellaceae bacterium]
MTQLALDATRQILEALSAVTRQLARASGGPDDGPPMTSTQRLALFETVISGPLRLSELAERMGSTAPTASRAVDGLVDLGLLERLPDPADRRAVRIDVTEQGRVDVEVRKARVAAALEPAVAALSEQDRARLAKLLERLADELD